MPVPSEPFTHDVARLTARRAAGRYAVGFALVAGLCVAVAPLATLIAPGLALPSVVASGLVLGLHANWVVRRIGVLYEVLAYVDLSAAGLAVQDVGGRRHLLPWMAVRHVNVSDSGVEVVAATSQGRWSRLRFGPDWPHADRLARRVVRYAYAHRRPLCVDGVACTALSLATLRPALSSAQPGADAV